MRLGFESTVSMCSPLEKRTYIYKNYFNTSHVLNNSILMYVCLPFQTNNTVMCHCTSVSVKCLHIHTVSKIDILTETVKFQKDLPFHIVNYCVKLVPKLYCLGWKYTWEKDNILENVFVTSSRHDPTKNNNTNCSTVWLRTGPTLASGNRPWLHYHWFLAWVSIRAYNTSCSLVWYPSPHVHFTR